MLWGRDNRGPDIHYGGFSLVRNNRSHKIDENLARCNRDSSELGAVDLVGILWSLVKREVEVGELPQIWPSGPGIDPMQNLLHNIEQLVATVDQEKTTLT